MPLDRRFVVSDSSVMTEISKTNGDLPPAIERFVLHWGEMGTVWGVNRSIGQIHALLYVCEAPIAAEDIAEKLGMARSNVSNSLRELIAWNLIRRVHVMGDRRDFYLAEADLFEMVRRIAEGRKAREIDPTLEVLRACAADAAVDRNVSPTASRRLKEMLGFVETVDHAFAEVVRLPAPTLMALMRMGGAVARFVRPVRGRAGKRE